MKILKVFFFAYLCLLLNARAQSPQANFIHAVNRQTPLRITFTDLSTPAGEINQWNWDFGDGTAAATMQNPSHLYSFAGEYTVKLTVTRGSVQSTVSKKITVTTELKAIFSKSASTGAPPLTVALDGSASTGFITEQLWVISPTSGFTYVTGNSASEKASIKFTTPNTYNVSLRVSDGTKVVESAKQTIVVKNQPVVDFDWDKPAYVGRPIQFRDKTQYPCPNGVTQVWTFPENGSSTLPNPIYTFNYTGTFDIKLCVADACGNATCITKKVEVITPTVNVFAQFTASRLSIRKGQSVDFYDTSVPQANIKGWFWNFELPRDFPAIGDIAADNFYTTFKEKVSHVFNNAGTFKVRLQVTNDLAIRGTYFEVIVQVFETPELKPGQTVAGNKDVTLSDDLYAGLKGMPDNGIYVYKKSSESNSGDWGLKETFYGDIGGYANWNELFHDIKLKHGKLIVTKTEYFGTVTTYSYQVFEGVGTKSGVQTEFGPQDEIPATLFSPNYAYGLPKVDIHENEVAIATAEATGTYIYLVKRGFHPQYPTILLWSNSTVIKTKIKDSTSPTISNMYMDESSIVTQIDGAAIIYEKGADGNWDFSRRKTIPGPFKAVSYSNNTIMATISGCASGSSNPIIYVYEKPATGWVDNPGPNARFYIEDDEITETTQVCIPNGTSLFMSEKYAVVKVQLTTGTTSVLRQYVYKKWGDFWVDSKQTYKIMDVLGGTLPPETSNFDCLNAIPSSAGGLVAIYNYENYCLLEPYIQTSFSISGAQHDVVKGVIELGGGTAVFNSGTTAKYIGRNITLKPGLTIKPSNVSLKVVETCDELYFK
jgi:PKD repeat protein